MNTTETGLGGTSLGLTAVIVAVTEESPRILVVRRMRHDPATPTQRGAPETAPETVPETAPETAGQAPDALPFGPFDPGRHRTLELGLWQWVEDQTGLDLRYVEQLYTFGNQYRDPRELQGGPRAVSVAYLALTLESAVAGSGDARWRDCYGFLPWEDWRDGPPRLVDEVIRPKLRRWVRQGADRDTRRAREERYSVCFGLEDGGYDCVRSLERYELLYEAGLVPEAHRDRRSREALQGTGEAGFASGAAEAARLLGPAMALDDRRILAAALGRIRGKLAYRPVVFELLPREFTLFRLQRVVEALAGMRLHKQNFRRMVMTGDLVEATGRQDTTGRGRPAELYRFRRDVLRERGAVGVGLPSLRAAE